MRGDLHVHSCLSPCANITMTPKGIMNNFRMEIIAITDHNCSRNARIFENACRERKIIFLPGIEITSVEEVHVLGYFGKISDLEKVSKIVYEHLPNVVNEPELFGYQLIVNEKDEFVGMVEKNLSLATDLRFEDVVNLIKKHGGIPVPAHVDRKFGVLYQLGFVPDMEMKIVEVTKMESMIRFKEKGYTVLSSSDAHNLDDLGTRYSIFPDDVRNPFDILKRMANREVKTFWEMMES